MQLLILITGEGKLQPGESEVSVKSILIYKTLSMMSNIGLYLPQCTLNVIKLQIKVSRHFQRGQDFEDIEMEKII